MFLKRHKNICVCIPESPLLNLMRSESKYQDVNRHQHMGKALENLNYFQTTDFWRKDKGYSFIERYLFPLLRPGSNLVEYGCSVGPLPEYLKRFNYWKDINYHGFDINESAITLARRGYPEGKFNTLDLQTTVNLDINEIDIVFEKGTIISSYYPYKVLENLLKLSARNVLLVHSPILTTEIDSEGKFISVINISEKNAYLISVMDEIHFKKIVNTYDYQIEAWIPRRGKVKILNNNSYKLVDMLLTKKAS